jgi:hypothetical protein
LKLPSWEYLTPNSIVDCTFYNIGCLDNDEIRQLAWIGKYHNEPPGTVIIVSPKSRHAGEPRIKVVIGDAWRLHVPDGIDAIAMAGVGSSILGTAALAKDVADQLGQPVLGVVSGTGTIGAPIDGLTGWYLYGTINQRASTLKIGTLGAVVAIPDDVGSCQVLGGLDFLGWLNSRPDVARHLIPNVWHSLNPSVPLAMSLHRDVWGKFGPSSAFA